MPIYTQAATVGQSSSGTNFAITAGPAGISGNTSSTFTYTTGAVGDLVVVGVTDVSTITALASTAVTKWTLISTFAAVSLWYGTVTTPTVADTITISGTNSGAGFNYCLQQFVSATVGSWLPGTAASSATSGSPAPWAVPSTLPVAGAPAGYLYVGLMENLSGTTTYTPGGGYGVLTSTINRRMTWNPAITTAATPAAVTGSTGTNDSVGVYIGSYPSSSPATNTISLTPVPMGKSWVVSQLGFECIPASTITTATTTVTMNGRLLFGNTNANGGFVQGPPYITLNAGDTLAITPTGLPTGSSAIVNLYYNEYVAGQVPDASNTV